MTHVTPSSRPGEAVTARSPAKVNLQLSVGPPGEDGYHDLVTVFHAVSLFDEVTVRPASRTSVVVTGEGGASVPLGSANLAVRAAAALAQATGRRGRAGRAASGVRIEIRKRIPVAAGLAGGSADAAAALVACNELWRAGASPRELRDLGAQIGSDVPFALIGGTAVGQGRGDRLTRALASGSYHWVLAFAAGGLATPDVYAACDRLRARVNAARDTAGDGAGAHGAGAGGAGAGGAGAGGAGAQGTVVEGGRAIVPAPELSTELMAALRSGDPAAVGPLLTNDLQPAALSLQPVLRRALAAGRELGALGAIVSGSGPTCAFLAADATKARDLAVAITGAGVCRAVVQVSGPAPGACVVDPRASE